MQDLLSEGCRLAYNVACCISSMMSEHAEQKAFRACHSDMDPQSVQASVVHAQEGPDALQVVDRLEATLRVKRFNQLGGLQLDRDVRHMVVTLSEVMSPHLSLIAPLHFHLITGATPLDCAPALLCKTDWKAGLKHKHECMSTAPVVGTFIHVRDGT